MPSIFERGICTCCARRSIDLGFATTYPTDQNKIIWLCDDVECIRLAERILTMKQTQFDHLESQAADIAGNNGGQYLDEIGKTDLSQLTEEEWREFNRRIIVGYRTALTNELANAIPF